MFCSGCGIALANAQALCPQCGRPVAPAVPPIPGFEYQLASYSSKVKTLGILWMVYAGLSIVLGFAALSFAKHFFEGGFGPWMHGPMPPDWLFPVAFHFAWLVLALRSVLAVVAGWGLLEHAQWGKVLAIVVAILSILKFPFGTALAIATLVILLGYRNSALYERL
jgi:hypothetical protein